MLNFQAQQEAARRRTTWLVVAFVMLSLVVALLAAPLVHMAVLATFGGAESATSGTRGSRRVSAIAAVVDEGNWLLESPLSQVSAAVSVGFIMLLVYGSAAIKFWQLRSGKNVAEMLGGRLILESTTDPGERRLLNVVHEMALASRVSPPPVYVLDAEHGVNAFAAGYAPSDAVIAVTRGALLAFNRDQLQGVIAHEFSHIFNGDMRLNIRLIAMLHGLLVIYTFGVIVARLAGEGAQAMSWGGGKNRGGIVVWLLFIALLALILAAIGFVGHLAGAILRAMVSRQREHLADASAVQFTRNPGGIAGALRIAGYLRGEGRRAGELVSPQAASVAHMFFIDASTSWLDRVSASHPPLPARVKRIDPSWDGSWLAPPESYLATREQRINRWQRSDEARRQKARELYEGGRAVGLTAEEYKSHIAESDRAHGETGDGLPGVRDVLRQAADAADLTSLPAALTDAATDAGDAEAVILAVLLEHRRRRNAGDAARAAAQSVIRASVVTRAAELRELASSVPAKGKLPLVQAAVAALATQPTATRQTLASTTNRILSGPQRMDVFEWATHRLCLNVSRTDPGKAAPPGRAYLIAHLDAAKGVLSSLAHIGARQSGDAEAAYERGCGVLKLQDTTLLPAECCGFAELDAWLDELAGVNRGGRADMLKACAAAIGSDGDVRVREIEFLRVLAASLDVPLAVTQRG